jgi:bacterioferritin-associated ferredoxin
MYVCLCKGVSDSAIRREVRAGASSFREVRDRLGVATQCGKCACEARRIVADELPARTDSSSLFYNPMLAPGLGT